MDALALHLAVLSSLLGHPRFDTREHAAAKLHAAPAHVVALLAWHDDPEIRWRVKPTAVAHVWRAFAAVWDARGFPWVDAIEGTPWCGLDLPHSDALPHSADWPAYKEATRIWARWQIEKGADPVKLHAMLVEAEKRCQYWREHKRYP